MSSAGNIAGILPHALGNNIFGYVSDDQESLEQQLSLVNRSCNLELDSWSCARLGQVLQTNPSLYQHIQTLRMHHNGWSDLVPSNIMAVLDPKQLVNLQCISLRVNGFMAYKLSWPALHPELRSALYELLAKPDLIALELTNIEGIDISFIGRSRHLKELVLHGVEHSPSSDPSTPATPLTREDWSLCSLSVGQCGDALQCLRTATILPQPVELKVYWGPYDDKMDMAIKSFSCNVERYEIIWPNYEPSRLHDRNPHSAPLDFVCFPRLKTLKFGLQFKQLGDLLHERHLATTASTEEPLNFLQQIARLREAGTNDLESLEILVDLDDPDPIIRQLDPYEQEKTLSSFLLEGKYFSSWESLDCMLGNEYAFPNLKKVRIGLKSAAFVAPSSRERWEPLVGGFKATVMPTLTRRLISEVIY
ncbi:hypothetical protein D9611_008052 [Ephemerocybe angulata]|uniref:Uncharacterized protein n=1 Tax=Ephemerocybe angulata TaxID=980116 RepID=A0A8H5BZD7_9AGAR|nr:hypothetical protein D9611_008052 [Tulosesus angulatus]